MSFEAGSIFYTIEAKTGALLTADKEAMEAKFPSTKNEIVSQDDYDSAMSYADSVVGLSC